MITKKYSEDGESITYNITCPSTEWVSCVVYRNEGLDIFNCGLSQLEAFQSQPKFFPNHQISDYCLYLGTHTERYGAFSQKIHRYDLYAHRDWATENYYSTAIVYGQEPNAYMSGWPTSLSDGNRFQVYNELFWREYACNLITKEIMARFFEESFKSTFYKKQKQWLRL